MLHKQKQIECDKTDDSDHAEAEQTNDAPKQKKAKLTKHNHEKEVKEEAEEAEFNTADDQTLILNANSTITIKKTKKLKKKKKRSSSTSGKNKKSSKVNKLAHKHAELSIQDPMSEQIKLKAFSFCSENLNKTETKPCRDQTSVVPKLIAVTTPSKNTQKMIVAKIQNADSTTIKFTTFKIVNTDQNKLEEKHQGLTDKLAHKGAEKVKKMIENFEEKVKKVTSKYKKLNASSDVKNFFFGNFLS
jgi:hypothetical protein